MRAIFLVALVVAAVVVSGCSMTSSARNVPAEQGTVTHLNTTNIAVHLLFKKPVLGDASLQNTMDCCEMEMKDMGASRLRVVQSSKCTYWWLLPPITFVVHPVISNVAADAM